MTHARPRLRLHSLALATSLAAVVACRTSENDVHRWANTQQGPHKIVAVMSHDKYPDELRVEAAMTLVRMKPRSGRRIGIDLLVSGLAALPAERRAALVAGMVPQLEQEVRKPPPQPLDGGIRPEDASFPYKDAAFAMLSNQPESLVANEEQRRSLHEALAQWVVSDFARRMDDSSQAYGMGQLLDHLGPRGVRELSKLIKPEEPKIASIAGFIADLGDEKTKVEASRQLVAVAKEVDSQSWLDRKAPVLRKANETSGHKVEGKRFQLQLQRYQEEEMMRVLSSLKKVGKAPAVEYLLALAEDGARPEKRRATALAAMESHVERDNEEHLERLLALASGDATPDSVRDLALRRIGELPRKQIIEPLYALFRKDNWKIRWVAAELALETSEAKHLAEFMKHLGSVRNMAITEPIRYGKLIGSLKGAQSYPALVNPYKERSQPAPVRLAAFGYYLEHGRANQLDEVEGFAKDGMRVPECAAGADQCEWNCEVVEGKDQVVKEIKTVGDFVEYCVKPAMAKRVPFGSAGKTTTASAPKSK